MNLSRTSIRKGLAVMSGVLFSTACIWYLIKHNGNELPISYITVIGGIIMSYFAKDALRNVKVISSPKKETNE